MPRKSSEFGKQVEDLSGALADLINPLDQSELEALAVSAIREHRLALQKAGQAYDVWMAATQQRSTEEHTLKAAYLQAMLDNCVQMTIVGALIDQLGYVPTIDGG